MIIKKMDKILTICIPTYNRARTLKESLDRLCNQITKEIKDLIYIFISDNCSPDSTKDVVQGYIDLGYPIMYHRNEENVGVERNFLKCFYAVRTQYMWLLGDDDFLKDGSLTYVVNLLQKNEYGYIYLNIFGKNKENVVYNNDSEKFIKDVSFMFGFMSSHIIDTSNINEAPDSQKYIKSSFIHIPLFINAARNPEKVNKLFINKEILDVGHASASNGGFNYFEVTSKNYLGILKDLSDTGYIKKSTFEYLKRHNFANWLLPRFYQYVILKKVDANYDLKNSWTYLFNEYKFDFYFYYGMVLYPFRMILNKIFRNVDR